MSLDKHIAPLRDLARRHFPDDDKAQEDFVLDHLTRAAETLGHSQPRKLAKETLRHDAANNELAEALMEETGEVAEQIPQPVERKRKKTKKNK